MKRPLLFFALISFFCVGGTVFAESNCQSIFGGGQNQQLCIETKPTAYVTETPIPTLILSPTPTPSVIATTTKAKTTPATGPETIALLLLPLFVVVGFLLRQKASNRLPRT